MRISTWDQVMTTEETNSFVRELACEHLRQVWTELRPQSYTARVKLAIHNALWYEDFQFLVSCELDYTELTSQDAYHLRQALAFYSKRSDLELGIDKEEVAYVKFQESEVECSKTNEIFRKWSTGGINFLPHVEAFLYRAQRKIAHVLGDVPVLDSLHLRFGPGATTQITKRNASARRKLGQTYACSEDLIPMTGMLLESMPAWIPFEEAKDTALVTVEIHNGTLAFVPKNAKTHRSIVVEPMLNSMLQLGIGDYMASRLRRFGIDIRDQTRNQTLARLGSLHGELATLDLSSASDMIATGLVAHLLPPEWFDFLSMARTGTVEYKGSTIKLQKFSSMGNGFTFPLETLIFWALASAVAGDDETVSVYGDDIIVPVCRYDALCELLHTVGFRVNSAKSFASGPFRESCGKDYLLGIDIRPVYVKDRISGSSLFILHNFYMRGQQPEIAARIRNYIEPVLQVFGPDGYGDGHLIGDFKRTPHKGPSSEDRGWGGYTFETFTFGSRRDFRPSPGDFVFPSYSVYARDLCEMQTVPKIFFRDRKLADDIFGSTRAKAIVSRFTPRDGAALAFRDSGDFGVTLPGVKGYKRIKIYTLG